MFAKLFVAILFATVIGSALLDMRQQRLETMHAMVRLHREMDDVRQKTWDLQVRIAGHTEPEKLREAVEQADLSLEPASPPPLMVLPVQRPPRVAEIEHGSRFKQR